MCWQHSLLISVEQVSTTYDSELLGIDTKKEPQSFRDVWAHYEVGSLICDWLCVDRLNVPDVPRAKDDRWYAVGVSPHKRGAVRRRLQRYVAAKKQWRNKHECVPKPVDPTVKANHSTKR